eukprot:TRINITY_DN1769_c0_g2_i1.p1 TRINITY_DN1769_c0_g2~~TRINITY_DN1769_c0_g2_i1.p1  ORF type:complete len:631 (-),score=115.91 TRINITY_DN1769_c0_g2_i1:1870-3762(-)
MTNSKSGEERLIFYAAVANSKESGCLPSRTDILFEYKPKEGDFKGVAVDALREAYTDGLNCKFYSLSFDDTMISFVRADKGFVFMLVSHSSLTKKRAWELLEMVELALQQHRGPPPFDKQFADLLQSVKGKIPPRVDLVVYPNAPHAYKDEEQPPDPSQFVGRNAIKATSLPSPGWKTLQQELEELSDEEEEDGSSWNNRPSGPPYTPPLRSFSLKAPSSSNDGDHASAAQAALLAHQQKMTRSMEVSRGMPPPKLLPKMPKAGGGGSNGVANPYAMSFADFKSSQHSGGTPPSPHLGGTPPLHPAAAKSHSRGSEGSESGSTSHSTLLRGELSVPKIYEIPNELDYTSASEEEACAMPVDEKKPLMQSGRGLSSTNSSGESPKVGGSKKRGALMAVRPKSQEHQKRVNPEVVVTAHREHRTDAFVGGFQSERSRPQAGRIGDRAPSGLSWEEEIRRHHVARGIPPPRSYSGHLSASESPEPTPKASSREEPQQEQQQPPQQPQPQPQQPQQPQPQEDKQQQQQQQQQHEQPQSPAGDRDGGAGEGSGRGPQSAKKRSGTGKKPAGGGEGRKPAQAIPQQAHRGPNSPSLQNREQGRQQQKTNSQRRVEPPEPDDEFSNKRIAGCFCFSS